MTVRVGINGFGRIGRNFFRAAKQAGADIDFVAVNDLGSIDTMAHLLKYDSVLGKLPDDVKVVDEGIYVAGDTIKVLQVRDPKELPWGDLGVDVVVESTGFFTDRAKAAAHLEAGAPVRGRVGPVGRRRRHVRDGRQRRHVRPGHPQGRVERLVHHELLRAAGEGDRRRLRCGAGPHDHGPRLHRRPDAGRRPPQRPAPGPGGRHQHRAHLDRRRPGHRPRARVAERQARRHLAAGAGARRLDHRPRRRAEDAGHRWPRSTPPIRRRPRRGR